MFTRKQLDHLVIDVECILISVVQGVALTTLAIEAAPMLRAHHVLSQVFLATGTLFVLSFWAVALIHTVSFVMWPMDVVHYFFYFVLALLECLTFAQMDRPHAWFGYSLACFVVTWGLYAYDLRMIRQRRAAFDGSVPERALYHHILRGQWFEMTTLMPAGLAFNLIAYLVVGAHPAAALPLALMQLLLTVLFVVNFLRSFTERRRLITDCITD